MDGNDPLDREGVAETHAADPSDPIDWDKIKHAYVHGDMSLDRIADAFGSSETTISDRAKKGGWVRLVGTKPLPRGRRPRPPGTPRPKQPTADQLRRRQMVRRLFEVLDGKMRQLEDRMANAEGGSPPSAADTERDARSERAGATLRQAGRARRGGEAVSEQRGER